MRVGEDSARRTDSSSLFTCHCSPLLFGDEEKEVIYASTDSNKCLGCSGADALLSPVESSEAHRHRRLHSGVYLWGSQQNVDCGSIVVGDGADCGAMIYRRLN